MIKLLLIFLILPLTLATTFNHQVSKLEGIDVSQEPTQSDWQYFFKMPPKDRELLWNYHEKSHKKLASWSWTWRIGWVQACEKDKRVYCENILKDALFDEALVVRAEAATALGNRYEGKGNAALIKLFEKAYHEPENTRNGKPIMVQKRILHALKQISSKDALDLAERLAKNDPVNFEYWQKIKKF